MYVNYILKIIIFSIIFWERISCGHVCDECVQSSSEMYFCYKTDYSGRRCDKFESLRFCPLEFIEKNSCSGINVIENADFRNYEVEGNLENYIQFKPQKVEVLLRKGDAVNFTFSYKPAKNYPLELYYLMDLTHSMKNDLETLVNLGEELGYSLKDITENFKIAFGSYVDKLLMPFSFTSKYKIDNPCNDTERSSCGKSYLIQHIQNFTNDLDLFVREVKKKSHTSANLDDLEGGMEALMQVVTCGKRIGWSEASRKFVIISTGSYMHLAGDGLLSGTFRRNTGECLIDNDGNYPSDNPFDYPSLEEIHKQLKKHKVNVIFAVKQKVRSYYETMEEIIYDSAFVGTLKKDSKNIIQLTREGYMDFFKQAKFSVDSNHTADLDIKFFANCDGSGFIENNTCSNVVLDNVLDFIVEIKLNDFSAEIKKESLFIVEKNIHERIRVDLEYYGFCKCDSMSKLENREKCMNGDFRCGECICHQGWSGTFCNETCSNSLDPCRRLINGVKETSCSRRGDCECGKCICDFPYQGKYCEFKCPVNNGKICSNHGQCIDNDVCVCDSDYNGKDCSCEISTKNCMVLGKICNEHGKCKCNKCYCDENYKGKMCEYYVGNKDIKGFCSEFLNQTLSFVENGTEILFYYNTSIRMIKVSDENYKIEGEGVCFARFIKAANYCEINYKYNLENEPILLTVQANCYTEMTAAVIGFPIIIIIVLVGLIGALIWKIWTYRKDKMEYVKFQEELRNNHKQSKMENPLYESPITTYTVPTSNAKNKKL